MKARELSMEEKQAILELKMEIQSEPLHKHWS